MQIEEAIEKLKETAKQCRNSKECWENEDCCDCYVEVEDIFAIETVLNELEKQQAEIENLKEEEMLDKADIEEIFRLRKENEKKDKVIDKILNKFIEGTGYYYSEFDYMSKEEIKEYFYKRASEEDVTDGR